MCGSLLGIRKSEIETPALLIDLDVMESNIAMMASYFEGIEADLRPHVKTHKTPILAHKQIEAGAIGITCAKLGEAEVMAAAGIKDVLIANQIVGSRKIARLVNLVRHADVMVAVDNPQNVAELSGAAEAKGVKLSVLVEVNVGMNRCGVEPGEPALVLSRKVDRARGLRYMGLMGYEGHTVFIKDYEVRKRETEKAMKLLIDTKQLIQDAGLDVCIVSAGGTGTYNITGPYPGVTEIQAGSYILMDTRYRNTGVDFGCALSVLATVISRPNRDTAVIDAGKKTLTEEFGLPAVVLPEGAKLVRLSEEHGILALEQAGPTVGLEVGDKVELIPSHCCTTINLHDEYYAVRDGWLEAVWDIAGRGRIK